MRENGSRQVKVQHLTTGSEIIVNSIPLFIFFCGVVRRFGNSPTNESATCVIHETTATICFFVFSLLASRPELPHEQYRRNGLQRYFL